MQTQVSPLGIGPSPGPSMPPPIPLLLLPLLAQAAVAGPEVMKITVGDQQHAQQHSGSSNTQQQWIHNAVEYPLMGDNEQIPEIPKSNDGFKNIPSRRDISSFHRVPSGGSDTFLFCYIVQIKVVLDDNL